MKIIFSDCDDVRTKAFKQFFADRTAINIESFCVEVEGKPNFIAGKHRTTRSRMLNYIVSGERSLTNKTYNKYLPVMKKYGFVEPDEGNTTKD